MENKERELLVGTGGEKHNFYAHSESKEIHRTDTNKRANGKIDAKYFTRKIIGSRRQVDCHAHHPVAHHGLYKGGTSADSAALANGCVNGKVDGTWVHDLRNHGGLGK